MVSDSENCTDPVDFQASLSSSMTDFATTWAAGSIATIIWHGSENETLYSLDLIPVDRGYGYHGSRSQSILGEMSLIYCQTKLLI